MTYGPFQVCVCTYGPEYNEIYLLSFFYHVSLQQLTKTFHTYEALHGWYTMYTLYSTCTFTSKFTCAFTCTFTCTITYTFTCTITYTIPITLLFSILLYFVYTDKKRQFLPNF